MSVGGGFAGRRVKIDAFGGSALAGVVSKDLSYSISNIDTTDDTSGGNAEYLSEPGRVDRTLSISGKVKNLDILASLEENLANGQNIYTMTLSFPDGTTTGSTLSGDWAITSFSIGAPHEEATTYELEIASSGGVTFTPAT